MNPELSPVLQEAFDRILAIAKRRREEAYEQGLVDGACTALDLLPEVIEQMRVLPLETRADALTSWAEQMSERLRLPDDGELVIVEGHRVDE